MRLFKQAYGDCYPIGGVYDAQFWQSHIGSRFVSLLGSANGKPVWHAALHPDKSNSKNMQLAYMVGDINNETHLAEVIKYSWEVIQRQAAWNDWSLLYHFIGTQSATVQRLTQSIYGSIETALCPAYLGCEGSHSTSERSSVFVAQNVFKPDDIKNKILYVPKHHLEVISYLYSPLNIPREFESSANRINGNGAKPKLDGLELRYFSLTQVCHATVVPSEISNHKSVIAELSSHPAKALYLFVDMEDKKCPDFCSYLEEFGFKFCGVSPLLQGKDQILYWRQTKTDLRKLELHSERARFLASYIQNYDLRLAQKAASQATYSVAAA